jgi:hypothetical protein
MAARSHGHARPSSRSRLRAISVSVLTITCTKARKGWPPATSEARESTVYSVTDMRRLRAFEPELRPGLPWVMEEMIWAQCPRSARVGLATVR